MKLNDLFPSEGSRKKRTRVGLLEKVKQQEKAKKVRIPVPVKVDIFIGRVVIYLFIAAYHLCGVKASLHLTE